MFEFEPDRPKWQQVADIIRQRIQSGTYPPKYLVSELSLVQEFGIARDTARKAVRALREEGLLYTIPHMGSFVSPPSDTEPAHS
ncbi:Arabinose metabolism transcriptional repressor [Nonomuraea coxensis DSM 45129]|uniref:Arabinose metabolism transcriptional repressor n=1 Tax=Nonomuraea coxensis DSM 45129 TaxID=1122611 RepID=A0ABX8TXJ6_9ACTN|nr:GntR family transcriptional regulator [Nonomuraea coxensis]QYC39088.1 Arabinose metabolism transcriptional repressor [Nonomuraea coxensis DSM 45129]